MSWATVQPVFFAAVLAATTAWIFSGTRRARRDGDGLRAGEDPQERAERELVELLTELSQSWRWHMREPHIRITSGGGFELGAKLGVDRGLLAWDRDSHGNVLVRLVASRRGPGVEG